MTIKLFPHFSLLMWKNFLIKWRHKRELIIEILIPLGFCAILLLLRGIDYPKTKSNPTIFGPISIDKLDSLKTFDELMRKVNRSEIDYAPEHPQLETLMLRSLNVTGADKYLKIRGFKTANDLEEFTKANESFVGVIFDVDLKDLINGLPKDLKFSLRFPANLRTFPAYTWETENRISTEVYQGPRNKYQNDGGPPPGYIAEAFITVQNAISEAYIDLLTKDRFPNITIEMQRFPYKPYISEELIILSYYILPFMILMSLMYPCIQAVKHLTVEKESQLKEAMRIMGLSTSLHWTAWFFTLWTCLLVTVFLIICLLRIPWFDKWSFGVFNYTSFTVLFAYFAVYAMTTVTFSFMMSTFFRKATVAGAITAIIWIALYMPYMLSLNRIVGNSFGAKIGLCLFFNTAMGFGFGNILFWEGLNIGSQWNNLFDAAAKDGDLNLGCVMLMLIAHSVIYMMITLYIEKIMPGSFGRGYAWYFFVKPSFWFPQKSKYVVSSPEDRGDADRFETEQTDNEAGIRVKGLSKKFGKNLVVNNLTVNMYNNEITVLLGHNGAGKTTSILMITGLITPSSGTAIVNGFDICDSISGVRESLGFCPQENILFDELTVEEHIIFYSRLKGLNDDEVKEEIEKYLKILQFEDKRNAQARTLSGGMKRKLSVGVALCGRSKIVICDEPSAGMDPSARRALWDLLLLEKKDRTILLTTHFMDEADVLADRIAIMSEGQLQCSGTSFFLKKKFGTGYRLICSKRRSCQVEDVTNLIRKYVPEVTVKTNIGTELSYDLPEGYLHIFEQMLKDLETNQDDLNLDGYGISTTTLEDVFLKTGSEFGNEPAVSRADMDCESFDDPKPDVFLLPSSNKSIRYQLHAMLLKRIYNFKRNWHIFLFQLLIPLFLVYISMESPESKSKSKDLPPLSIGLDIYGRTTTLLETKGNTDYVESFEELFRELGPDQELAMINGSFSNEIVQLQKKDIIEVNRRYVAAVTLYANSIVAWFNNEVLHSAPIALNLVHNAILKSVAGSAYNIKVTNFPLPFGINNKTKEVADLNIITSPVALNIIMAMAFISAIFIWFIIRERVLQAKHLEIVSGVHMFIFWLIHFLWDFMIFAIISACLVILLSFYQEAGFSTFAERGRLYLLFLVYGFASIPFTYVFSLAYNETPTGLSRLIMVHTFTGYAVYIVILIVTQMNPNNGTANFFKEILYFFPHFALSQGLENLLTLGKPEYSHLNSFMWKSPGISIVLAKMISSGLLIFGLLQIIENSTYFFGKLTFLKNKALPPLSEEGRQDDKVQEERDQIEKLDASEISQYNLVMRNVTKFYKKFVAVNQISVRVGSGECFGLLGTNGAGKTSTFKMLTGDATISHGKIWVRGHDIETSRSTVFEMIGYCPQFDGLLLDLTGAETLKIFSLLRGIPIVKIDSLIKSLAKELEFEKHLNKKIQDYSGGNRRKLNAVIAILGNPHLVYLDEPSTGIDPVTRRKLWNLISRVRDAGESIVLSSHSMDECEALCTMITIMVNGEFRCLDSTQNLKNKFSTGISLTIKLKTSSNENRSSVRSVPSEDLNNINLPLNQQLVLQFINDNFEGAVLKDSHQSYLKFEIPKKSVPYSRIFGIMEKNKKQLCIEDYSLSQSTLEEVFLNLTQNQRREDENKNKKGCKRLCCCY